MDLTEQTKDSFTAIKFNSFVDRSLRVQEVFRKAFTAQEQSNAEGMAVAEHALLNKHTTDWEKLKVIQKEQG